jgi:uncharacterized membrane protein
VISDLLFFSATGTKMPLFFMLYGMVVLILSIVRSLTYTQIINLSVLEIETVHASVKKSKEIMKGNKFKILVIMVCYFALAFLSALTFGITMVVLQPLMSIVMTLFTLSAVELHYQNTQSSFSKEDIQNTL